MKEGAIIVMVLLALVLGIVRHWSGEDEARRAKELRELKRKEFKHACDYRNASSFTTTDPWVCISNTTGEAIQLLPIGVRP